MVSNNSEAGCAFLLKGIFVAFQYKAKLVSSEAAGCPPESAPAHGRTALAWAQVGRRSDMPALCRGEIALQHFPRKA